MKLLHVRRHSLTAKGRAPGSCSALSAVGVRLARSAGEAQPLFDHVVTSPSPRSIETAIAMGHAVDEVVAMPSCYVAGLVDHHEQWSWADPFDQYASLLDRSPEFCRVVDVQVDLWRATLDRVADGGRVLVVSHGGTIEPALVRALPDADRSGWGAPFSHLDGTTLTADGARFTQVSFHRVVAEAGQ